MFDLPLRLRRLLASCAPFPVASSPCSVPNPKESGGVAADDRRDEREGLVAALQGAGRIVDPLVLDALRAVPRHRFVPEDVAAFAYRDRALPIAHDQTISQPTIVGLMTQACELRPGDRVLEVGTGSGYQAAVLAEVVGELWTIEIVEPLAERARELLAELDYDRVHVRAGDGYRGWPEEAPFDAIVVTAAPDHVPLPLLDQLAMGGRLVLPVGDDDQTLVRIRRTEGGFERDELLAVRFVPMTGEALGDD